MAKTAMQEIIEWMDESPRIFDGLYQKAVGLLEKEKQQIIDAYKAGQEEMEKMVEVYNKKSWFFEIIFDETDSPEDYYRQTFNQ